MAGWSRAELDAIGRADELRLASRRADDTLRPFVTIWVVRDGDGLYVRSGWGRGNGWFRRALVRHRGRIEAGGTRREVVFEEVDPDDHADVDAAYHAKYDRYGDQYVGPVVTPESWSATFRLVPAD